MYVRAFHALFYISEEGYYARVTCGESFKTFYRSAIVVVVRGDAVLPCLFVRGCDLTLAGLLLCT